MVRRNLDGRSVTVGSTGATASWTVDATPAAAGGLAGDYALTNDLTGFSLSSTTLRYSGGGASASRSLAVDGPYAFDGLPAGGGLLTAQSFFSSPVGYLDWPRSGDYGPGSVTIVDDETTTVDVLGELGAISAALDVSGFVDNADLNVGIVYYRGRTGSAQSGYAYRYLDDAGVARVPVLAGDWGHERSYVQLFEPGTAEEYVNATYQVTYYGTDDVSVVAGAETTDTIPALDLSTATVVFDIIEPDPAAPQQTLASPRVSASRIERDPVTSALVEQAFVNSSGLGTPVARAALRVIGEPGTYSATATANVDGANVTFGRFTLELFPLVDTPIGTDVEVSPSEAVDLTFGDVTAGGVTTVSEVGFGPQVPADFALLTFDLGSSVFYDINTTAEFTGEVTVCIDYDPGAVTPSFLRNFVRLYHYEDDTTWVDITDEALTDRTAGRICGQTTSFSFFALLVPTDEDGDGVFDFEDNCRALANPSQLDVDDDGIGDACDLDNDNDGVLDFAPDGSALDNCPLDPNPDQLDLDDDGAGDVCDEDDDGDDVLDADDNCPEFFNPDQDDLDEDGLGDQCDADVDGDAVDDAEDNCVFVANPDQADADGDLAGDACDADDDGDGVDDSVDVCPLTFDPDLGDLDGDGIGDACETDADGDGIDDGDDLCPESPGGLPVDADGCTGAERVARACVPEDYGRLGRYVRCVVHEAGDAWRERLITLREKIRIVLDAIRGWR